jgi:hypothetical protein
LQVFSGPTIVTLITAAAATPEAAAADTAAAAKVATAAAEATAKAATEAATATAPKAAIATTPKAAATKAAIAAAATEAAAAKATAASKAKANTAVKGATTEAATATAASAAAATAAAPEAAQATASCNAVTAPIIPTLAVSNNGITVSMNSITISRNGVAASIIPTGAVSLRLLFLQGLIFSTIIISIRWGRRQQCWWRGGLDSRAPSHLLLDTAQPADQVGAMFGLGQHGNLQVFLQGNPSSMHFGHHLSLKTSNPPTLTNLHAPLLPSIPPNTKTLSLLSTLPSPPPTPLPNLTFSLSSTAAHESCRNRATFASLEISVNMWVVSHRRLMKSR